MEGVNDEIYTESQTESSFIPVFITRTNCNSSIQKRIIRRGN